jgi:nitric oxide reductase NorD protein
MVNTATSEGLERFRLVASAIAGRLVEVTAAGAGDPPWTDGSTVYVDAGADARLQLQCVAVQAALLASRSLDPAIVGRVRRRSALAQRYLAVEGHRALTEQAARLPMSTRGLIDTTLAARTDSPMASLAIAESRESLPAAPGAFGALRPRHVVAPAEVRDEPAARRRARVNTTEALRELDDGEDDAAPTLELLSSPVGGAGPIGRLLARLLGDARGAGGGAPGTDAPTHTTPRGFRVARHVAPTTGRASAFDDASVIERTGARYPEWDVRARRYRHDWCTVVEVDAEPGGAALPESHDAHALRRPLARLGLELERRHRQLQGDDIDIDAAIEAIVEARAGSAPDEAIFIDSIRARRDLSVLLMLDISGSVSERSLTGGTVHEQQRAVVAALADALHDLGDRVAVFAFRSQGRSAVHVVPVKRFDDHFDTVTRRRLGSLEPGGYTRLGAAIRHGAATLERSGGTSRRLLVVVSDGFAYDHGYQGAYAEADARRALGEARHRGVGCLCLSVGADVDASALRRVFGTAAHASIPRAVMLAGVVGPLFRTALSSAEVQRRASQRTTRTRERLDIEGGTA